MSFIGGPRACIGYRFSLVECVEPSYHNVTEELTTAYPGQNEGSVVRASESFRI